MFDVASPQAVSDDFGKPVKDEENMQVETWEDVRRKYPMERDKMEEELEEQFVADCFKLYEKEGFSSVYWSPFTDHEGREGQQIEIVGRCTTENYDLCVLPMWKIKFPDGNVIDAYPEEIVPSEMRANGCRWFDKSKSSIDALIETACSQSHGPCFESNNKTQNQPER